MRQRIGESLHTCNHQFSPLIGETYPSMPVDQAPVIKDYLSGLSNLSMAQAVKAKDLCTLEEAMTKVKEQVQTDNCLHSRTVEKTSG